MTNNDFQSLFVIQLSCRCQQCDTCKRGMKGGADSPLLVVATCVHWCCGYEEPMLVGMVFGDGW